MFPPDMQGACAAAVPADVVGVWAVAAIVAAIVTFVGWCWGRTLDLKRDASWIVLACVGACLIWSGLRPRERVVIRPALNRELPSGDRSAPH
jgi:hypothetical protein